MQRAVRWGIPLLASLALAACQMPAGPDVDVDLSRELAGSNEVPPVATSASGTVNAVLRGNVLRVTGSFQDLEGDLQDVGGTPAHIHGPAGPDENAGVVFPLEVERGDDDRSGSFTFRETLTDEQRADFEAGRYYVNVHSAAYPGGELRAQLHADPAPQFDHLFEADLSGAQEVPPVTTGATGTATVAVQGDTLTVHGSFEGLESDLNPVGGTPAHIHGPAGPDDTAGVVFPLEVDADDDLRSGTLHLAETTLTAEQRADLEAGLYYVNVHTVDHPGGEIRGQLVPPAE